jgi:oxygen-independent coproporphyrinogen-3 oxidase
VTPPGPATKLSVYLSLPFCHHKCSYCDLNAYAGLNDLIPAYVEALVKEIQRIGPGAEPRVHTIYFGGGTPSIIPLNFLAAIFAALRESFSLTDDPEISFEANPDSVEAAYLNGLRALGVNRLSIGAQSAQANELALFGRTHTFQHVAEAIRTARRAGFEDLSLDLIYGVPGQTLRRWQDTLKRTLDLDPDHFSIYVLSLDFNTPMRAWVRRGLLPEPDDSLVVDMYEWADEELGQAGFEQYEISTWARRISNLQPPISNFQCRHNLQYWRNQPYLGLGAGAHGCWGGWRYANVPSPTAYVQRMESGPMRTFPFSPALAESISIDRQTEMDETMLTGLRLVGEGVRSDMFQARFGVRLEEVYAKEIREMRERKLIEWDEVGVRLTKEGRFVSNWVFEKFV